MLFKENFPFIFTLIIAALGWTLTHFADRVVNYPVLEYKVYEYNSKTNSILYRIRNISSSSLFSNINFYIEIAEDNKAHCIDPPDLKIPPPTHFGDERIQPKCIDGEYAIFEVPQLHPNTEIQLIFRVNKNVKTNLRVFCKNQAVKLVSSSPTTYLIRNEIIILYFLVAFWIICIGFFVLLMKTRKNRRAK